MANIIEGKVVLDTQQAGKDIDYLKNKENDLKEETKKTIDSFSSLENSIKNAFKKTAVVGFFDALKTGLDVMIKATRKQAEYVESANLLQVAYDNDTRSADKLIKSMNQLIGLDPSGLTKQLGTYRQFSSAMGIAGDSANMLSENLLKLQTDVSSLYNIDFDKAGKKLQSAIAGQTRPVRELGADITEASLQQELYNRGINKSVDELNRASKSVLIYLTLERQLSNANGDAAKTVNSLANQMRIFKEQVEIAGRQIGAVFIPILRSILPYANAILMVFNELMNMLLALLGVDVGDMAKEFGIGTQSVLDMTDQVDGLGTSLGGATKKAKELKTSLRGFDKLNNITTPTQASGGGGVSGGIGGALSGVDSALLDALKEYDLHLDSISNKAAQIRDSIMKWLGFEKDITGEWEFQKVTLGTIIGILAGGGGIIWAGSKILDVMGTIAEKGLTPMLKHLPIIKDHLKGMNDLQIWGTVAGLGIALAGIIKTITNIIEVINDPSWENWNDLLGGISLGVAGIGIAWVSMNPTSIPGWIMTIAGGMGYLITQLFDTRTEAEKLKGAQDKLNSSQQAYIDAQKENLNAYNNAIRAEENLTKAGKKLKLSKDDAIKQGEIYYEQIRSEDITLKDLNEDERALYSAYVDYIDSNNKLTASNKKVSDSYKQEIQDNLDLMKTTALQSKTIDEASKNYSDYATAIQDAYNKGTISSNEYTKRMGQIYNALNEDSRKTFIESIPQHLQNAVSSFGALTRATGGSLDMFTKFGKEKLDVKVETSAANNAITKLQNTFNTFKSNLLKPLKISLTGSVVTGGITTRATGGFVNTGELYVANENGVSEMIGKIGNQPAVANNDQIVEAVSIGVKRAVESANFNAQPTIIKATGDTSGLLNFINFEQEKRNRQYGL